jgi:hypothetical protein
MSTPGAVFWDDKPLLIRYNSAHDPLPTQAIPGVCAR